MIDNFSHLFDKARRVIKSLRTEAEHSRAEGSRLLALERKMATHTEKSGSRAVMDISTGSVARATLTILGIVALAWFLLEIKNVLALFFIATFLALSLDPFVDKMQERKIPRAVGILLIYIVFIGTTGIVISSFVPILATEIPNLAKAVLDWIADFGIDTSIIREQISGLQSYLSNLQSNLSRENIEAGLDVLSVVGQNAFAALKSIAGGVFSFVMALVIAFFMIIDEDGIKSFLIALFPRRYHRYIFEKGSAVEDKFGAWVRGMAILMVSVGLLTYIALKIAGVNYAATLAILAGLTELLPYVGPLIAFIPAVILALSQGGLIFALIVAAIYVGIQQIEGNVLVPLVMRKAVGLSPVIVMFAMLVGASFPETINPIVGIIISVPLATAISVFVRDYVIKEK